MDNFFVQGPLGTIECIVEQNKSTQKKILIMSHGFRGSHESGGYAKGVAEKVSAYADVIRYNFTGSQIMSLQVAELLSVIRHVKSMNPGYKIFLLGRSLGGAASIIASSMENVDGLILWATPNDFRTTFKNCMTSEQYQSLCSGSTLVMSDERGTTEIGPEFLRDFDNYNLSALLKSWQGRPVLLFHGAKDNIVNVQQAHMNISLLGPFCEFYIDPEGDHHLQGFSEQAGGKISAWVARQ
ncbi:MAG: hypothetical protein Q4D21_09835 [Phascolarctobacterium sp.]|nr:hypothetical protein [Phascolarctobacterium sp.]